jgi:hypothetical protein
MVRRELLAPLRAPLCGVFLATYNDDFRVSLA